MNLDSTDLKLLHLLDQDARQSLSHLARQMKIGNDLIEYRLRKYLTSGLIARCTPMFEPLALGVRIFKTYLKHRMPTKVLNRFIQHLDSHPKTYWLAEGYGTWDLVFSLGTPGVSEFQKEQDLILLEYGEYVLDMSVAVPVQVVRFPKHYLVGKGDTAFRWETTEASIQLDAVEKKILVALSTNCRLSITELAKRLELTPAIVSHRIKRMESGGAILGYRTQYDYEKLGMMVFKVFLELRDYSPNLRHKMLEYAKAEPHITCYIEQIGTAQVEIEIESNDYYHFSAVIEHFKSQFAERLGRIEHMLLRKDYYHRVPEVMEA